MKYDPFYLYENKRSRFDKFVKRQLARTGQDVSDSGEDSEPETKKKPAAQQRNRGVKKPAPPVAASVSKAPKQQDIPPQQDLINLGGSKDDFTDFVAAQPAAAPSQPSNDGFSNFVGSQPSTQQPV